MVEVDLNALELRVKELSTVPPDETLPDDAGEVVRDVLAALEQGRLRAAERGADGAWRAIPWVKQGVLLAFRVGQVVPMDRFTTGAAEGAGSAGALFRDKDTLPLRRFRPEDNVRVVPGGSAVRRGAYVAPGVVCMPPMYINVGAWVGPDTMIDSHALVGSCAQIGARVHLSAAAQVGGVLEPVNAAPVVLEDDVLVGGNAGVYEGTVVRRGAVIGAGVVLTRGTPLFDLVHERVIRAGVGEPLTVPEDAVVVGGARAVGSSWGREKGLSLYTPVIVKYRDERTNLATALEDWLR